MTLRKRIFDLAESVGGELGQEVSDLIDKTFKCHCDEIINIDQSSFSVYKHNGGLMDRDSVKWWLFIKCPQCEYRWSWLKVKGMIARQTDMEQEFDNDGI